FPRNARIEINDNSGGLSWDNTINGLTVSCWFKLSIPSGQSISEDMVILVNRRGGTESDPLASLIKFSINTGSIEFHTHGSGPGAHTYSNTLIPVPYLDR